MDETSGRLCERISTGDFQWREERGRRLDSHVAICTANKWNEGGTLTVTHITELRASLTETPSDGCHKTRACSECRGGVDAFETRFESGLRHFPA